LLILSERKVTDLDGYDSKMPKANKMINPDGSITTFGGVPVSDAVALYESMAPAANKLLNSDGSITTFGGDPVSDAEALYKTMSPKVNKFLNPDGSISTFDEILGGGGGGASAQGWRPRPDWIQIDRDVPAGSIVFLCTDTGGNGIAFQPTLNPTSGTYTVTVNNGTSDIYTVTNASNTKFEYRFAKGGGKPCADGSTTYKVTLTGNISGFTAAPLIFSFPNFSSILWCVIDCPSLNNIAGLFASPNPNPVRSVLIECCDVRSCGSNAFNFDQVFLYSNMLQKVVLPSNVTALGASSFGYCTSLRELSLQSPLTSIGAAAFSNCSSLPGCTTAATMGIGVYQNCNSLKTASVPTPFTVTSDSNLFSNCQALSVISGSDNIKSSVEIAIANMFSYCCCLRELDLSGMLLASFRFAGAGTSILPYALENLWWHPASTFSSATAPQIQLPWCNISAVNLNDIFSRLPTVTGKTISINGNPGAAACDRTIATARGWTVTG